eukprot:scpid78739/ scgid30134/ 
MYIGKGSISIITHDTRAMRSGRILTASDCHSGRLLAWAAHSPLETAWTWTCRPLLQHQKSQLHTRDYEIEQSTTTSRLLHSSNNRDVLLPAVVEPALTLPQVTVEERVSQRDVDAAYSQYTFSSKYRKWKHCLSVPSLLSALTHLTAFHCLLVLLSLPLESLDGQVDLSTYSQTKFFNSSQPAARPVDLRHFLSA